MGDLFNKVRRYWRDIKAQSGISRQPPATIIVIEGYLTRCTAHKGPTTLTLNHICSTCGAVVVELVLVRPALPGQYERLQQDHKLPVRLVDEEVYNSFRHKNKGGARDHQQH